MRELLILNPKDALRVTMGTQWTGRIEKYFSRFRHHSTSLTKATRARPAGKPSTVAARKAGEEPVATCTKHPIAVEEHFGFPSI